MISLVSIDEILWKCRARLEDSVQEISKPLSPVEDDAASQAFRVPQCPSCGWHDVRLSYTKNVLDVMLGAMSVHRFKCRSCGAYFRRWHRAVASPRSPYSA